MTHIKRHFLPATFHMHVNSYGQACIAELTSSIKKQTKNGQTQFVDYTRSHILMHHSTQVVSLVTNTHISLRITHHKL